MKRIALLASLLCLTLACRQETAVTPVTPTDTPAAPTATTPPETGASASANLEARSGSEVTGTVRFTELPDQRVLVSVAIQRLTPNTEHGFHIHEVGDCSAPDSTSAGDHFNPTGDPHGGRHGEPRHAGDFGNLSSDPQGQVNTEFEIEGLTVQPGPNSVVGRAVVVHAQRDDLTTQPTGDSGARIACGVVR